MEILEHFYIKTIEKNKHRVWIAKFGVFQFCIELKNLSSRKAYYFSRKI